jgi:chromosome segregation ATPase
VGHGPPEVLKEDHDFGEIKVDRASVNPQIAQQFSPIFLINPSKTSGSVAAEIISDIGRLSDVQSALKNASSDRRGSERTLKVRKQDLEDYEDDLEEYSDLDKTLTKVDELERLRDGIKSLQEEISRLEKMRGYRNELQEKIDRLSSLEDIEIPSPTFDEDFSEIRELKSINSTYIREKEKYNSLKGVTNIEIPSPMDTRSDLSDLEETSEIRDEYRKLEDQIDSLEDSVGTIDGKIDKVDQMIDKLFKEAGNCPMCEQEIE